MKRKISPLILSAVLVLAMLLVPMLAMTSFAAETTEVSKSHTDMASIAGVTVGSSTGVVNGTDIPLDDNISVRFDKGTSTSNPCIYSESVRLYQGGATLTIMGEGMTKIVITLANNADGDGPIAVTGGTADNASAPTNYVYTITVDAGVSEVVVTTKGTEKNSRLYVSNIAVTYEAAGTTEPEPDVPACEHANTTTTTDKATCTEAGSTTVVCDDCKATISTTVIEALGHNYENNVCTVCGEEKPNGGTFTYTFSDYDAGTQYAANEKHKLDDNTTVVTTDCHFTTQLRIYSSSTNNGYVIIQSLTPITNIGVNAGNKVDTLVIYGSNDEGATWTEAATVSVTSTSYKDYTVELPLKYMWLKLDVKGSNQVRLASMTLTTVALEDTSCSHTNTTTTTVDATCTATGSITVTCDECNEIIGYEIIPMVDHNWDEGVVLEGDEATCTKKGTKTYTCNNGEPHTKTEEIDMIDHDYDDETHLCSVCGKVDPASIDYSGRYYIATTRGDNYFYMTSTVANNRYTAVDSKLTTLPESVEAVDGYVFVLVKNDDGTYCIYAEGVEGNNYLGWTKDNSGILVAEADAKIFTVDYTNGIFNIHFTGDAERYLSLNGTSGNDFFAFYKGTQKQDLTLVPVVESEQPVTITGTQVELGADLSLYYNVTLAEGYDIANVKAVFTMNGKTVTVTEYVVNGDKYTFIFKGIGPHQMDDNIAAEFYYGEDVVASAPNYSVKDNLLGIYAGASAELKTLIEDTLNYGAAAQKFMGETENFVNAGYEDKGSTDLPDESAKVVGTPASKDVYVTALGVNFDYVNRIYVKFYATSTEGLTVKADGNEIAYEQIGENTYIAYTNGIYATALGETVNITLNVNGEEVQYVNYSVNTYAYAMMNDADMSELVIALYRYGKSAATVAGN